MENGSLDHVLDGPNSVLENGQMEYSKINGLTLCEPIPTPKARHYRYIIATRQPPGMLPNAWPAVSPILTGWLARANRYKERWACPSGFGLTSSL